MPPAIPPDFVNPANPVIPNGVYQNIPNAIGAQYYVPYDLAKFGLRPPGWQEVEDGYREHDDENGMETLRTFVGPFSSRSQMMLWLRGTAWRDGAGKLKRIVPAQDPVHPQCYCSRAILSKGAGAVVNQAIPAYNSLGKAIPSLPPIVAPQTVNALAFVDNAYDGGTGDFILQELPGDPTNISPPDGVFGDGKCFIQATYRSINYEIMSDEVALAANPNYPEVLRFLERRYQPQVEAIPLARLVTTTTGGIIFNDPIAPPTINSQPIPEAGVLLLSTGTVEFVWRCVPDPPIDIIWGLLGKVNLAPVDGGSANWNTFYIDFPTQTLLFQQPTIRRSNRDVAGQPLWTIHMRASYRATGWNRLPAGDGNFYKVTWKNGNPLYQATDFLAPFAPSPANNWQQESPDI